jgi:hypothetical protein
MDEVLEQEFNFLADFEKNHGGYVEWRFQY